ncbi:MAG: VOC family protein [Arenibacterium sp.]
MPIVKTNGTLTLAMSVANRRASADWYARMLGFELLFHADDAGWSEMSVGIDGVTLGLGEQNKPVPGNCVPVFGVSDIDAERKAMEAEDVEFDGDTLTIEGMVRLATFYDGDGNALMLAQDLTRG